MHENFATSRLLPDVYAHYLPLFADALRFFLERLSASRLRRILSEQLQLPPSASDAQRLVTLLAHIPALHKLGQIVARDKRLTASFRRWLQRLESMTPHTPALDVVRSLNEEFNDWKKAGIELETEPLAEGSVAVVTAFTWRHGKTPARQGVFKLLKPGIERQLEEDLEILGCLGDFLDEDCARYHLPAVDYRDTFNTIRDLLAHEVHLDKEQKHLAEAFRIYGGMQSVVIPALFPFCSPKMTAMERIQGVKVADARVKKVYSRDRLARTVADALIAVPMFSSQTEALFHADPHAGNLFLTTEGRLAILDWSLVGRLAKSARAVLAQLMLGALTLNTESMEEAVEQLTLKKADQPFLREVLCSSLRELRFGRIPGLIWLTRLLDQLVLRAGVRPAPNLLLFRKVLLTLEGVLTDLTQSTETAHGAIDEAVGCSFLRHWIADWPARFQKPFSSKSFRTHLSTADLFSFLSSAPATFARWWSETILDMMPSRSRALL